MPLSRKSNQSLSIIILIVLLTAAMLMGADIITLTLRPLKYLGIPYPPILAYIDIIAPLVAAVIWLPFRRWWPKSSALIAYILCCMTTFAVAHWATDQLEKVTTTTWLTDVSPLETRLSFKIWEQADSNGPQLYIAKIPGHASALTAETKRLGIFRP